MARRMARRSCVIRSIPVVIMPVRALAVRAGRGGLWPGAEAGGDRVEPLADGRLALVALWLCAVCSDMALLLSGWGDGCGIVSRRQWRVRIGRAAA